MSFKILPKDFYREISLIQTSVSKTFKNFTKFVSPLSKNRFSFHPSTNKLVRLVPLFINYCKRCVSPKFSICLRDRLENIILHTQNTLRLAALSIFVFGF